MPDARLKKPTTPKASTGHVTWADILPILPPSWAPIGTPRDIETGALFIVTMNVGPARGHAVLAWNRGENKITRVFQDAEGKVPAAFRRSAVARDYMQQVIDNWEHVTEVTPDGN